MELNVHHLLFFLNPGQSIFWCFLLRKAQNVQMHIADVTQVKQQRKQGGDSLPLRAGLAGYRQHI